MNGFCRFLIDTSSFMKSLPENLLKEKTTRIFLTLSRRVFLIFFLRIRYIFIVLLLQPEKGCNHKTMERNHISFLIKLSFSISDLMQCAYRDLQCISLHLQCI